jgi:hypothetical protein
MGSVQSLRMAERRRRRSASEASGQSTTHPPPDPPGFSWGRDGRSPPLPVFRRARYRFRRFRDVHAILSPVVVDSQSHNLHEVVTLAPTNLSYAIITRPRLWREVALLLHCRRPDPSHLWDSYLRAYRGPHLRPGT